MSRLTAAGSAVLLATAVVMTAVTLGYVLHPAYTQRDTARAVAQRMRAGGSADLVLFAGAGDDISLFTGVRAISFYEPYGAEPLLERYRPGWMAAWLDWESAFPAQVSPKYELQQVATFRVYDDQPHHQIFVLYRMVPRGSRLGGSTK